MMPKQPTYNASIVVNQPNPKYGDFIDANVSTNAPSSGVRFTFSQNGSVVAVSSTVFHSGPSYTSEKCGLYSPIWTGGAADGIAEVILNAPTGPHGVTYKTIASVKFSVAA